MLYESLMEKNQLTSATTTATVTCPLDPDTRETTNWHREKSLNFEIVVVYLSTVDLLYTQSTVLCSSFLLYM